MSTYQFEAIDPQGKEIRDVIEAATQDEAKAMIRSMGYFVTKITWDQLPPPKPSVVERLVSMFKRPEQVFTIPTPNYSKIKYYILGHARHGKDHAADFLSKRCGLTFESSSMFCIRHFLFERLKAEFKFESPEQAYENRHLPGMREWLFKNIAEINKDDLTKLSTAIFEKYDIYVGLRKKEELEAAKAKWPDLLVIWIDAEGRIPAENSASCTIDKSQAHVIIENKGSLIEFEEKLSRFSNLINASIPKC